MEPLGIVQLHHELGDRVKIKEIDLQGRVVSIWITSTGTKYQVRYFWNCEIQEVYFYSDELEQVL